MILIALHFIPAEGAVRFALYMIPYVIVGYDILIKAGKGIKNRQPLDECLLMVIATLGAIILGLASTGDYTEAVAVMLFYQIGEWFQSYAVGKSRRNISDLMDIRPDYANIEQDGEVVKVDPDDVEVGTVIVCRPGEKVPIDGVIVEGSTTLNTSALTGESIPRDVSAGDEITSGCVNMTGVIKVRTTKEFGESTVSTILELVENASSRKSRSEDFITRFARIYTPAVVIAALVLAIIPPAALLIMGRDPMWGDWLYRALTFLVISCPCALVISIPLTFFAGIGGASREGVLVKGSNYLEALSKTGALVCDKTGTLTKGVFEVVEISPVGITSEELLRLAALAERSSSHPISKSIKAAWEKGESADSSGGSPACSGEADISGETELSGRGVTALIDGKLVAAGNDKLMAEQGITASEPAEAGTCVHVSVDGEYRGYIRISDVVKPSSEKAVKDLGRNGVSRIVMLTGDDDRVAEKVSRELGIKEYYAELLPGDKVELVEKLMGEMPEGRNLAFAGDGINDAPVLSRADIGIAMGAMGSDAAIEAADIVLMDDDPAKMVKAIRIARRTLRIVKENIWFAIGIKVACLVLGALGLANMWLAIFADVGVMVIAVLNALRALFVKKL